MQPIVEVAMRPSPFRQSLLGGAGGRNVVRQGRFVARRARRALAAFKLRVMGDAFALADLTREEIRRTAGACTVVLPLGATEQHGTHLPVSVDTVVCERIATEAADLADGGPFLVAPALPYGVSDHHLAFPGTLSLRSATFLAVLSDLLRSLSAWGARSVFAVNGHGGNDAAMR